MQPRFFTFLRLTRPAASKHIRRHALKPSKIILNPNPQYDSALEDWILCSDCFSGERAVKRRGELYLPRTEGQMADPVYGIRRYEAYKSRANYFNYFASTIISMIGILHREPPEAVELPPELASLEQNFSVENEPLSAALARISFLQLAYGRCGVLLDPQESGAKAAPRAAVYPAHRILDWGALPGSEGFDFLVLDESGDAFDPVSKSRVFRPMLRLCALDPARGYYSLSLTPEEYAAFDFRAEQPESSFPCVNGKRLEKIPFTFFNASDNTSEVGRPPLLPLANICLAVYRGEADYRHALYMQGQATLFLKGFPLDDPPMTGAGNYIHTESPDASGSFLEISGSGLGEMRAAQNDLHAMARSMGVLLEENGDSGTALKTRLTVRTSLLRTVASAAGTGMTDLLKTAAEWCSADPEKVLFKPNLDFSDSAVSTNEVVQLWNARSAGLPISERSIHDWLRKNDFTGLAYEDELAEIKSEGGIPTRG